MHPIKQNVRRCWEDHSQTDIDLLVYYTPSRIQFIIPEIVPTSRPTANTKLCEVCVPTLPHILEVQEDMGPTMETDQTDIPAMIDQAGWYPSDATVMDSGACCKV